MSGSSYVSGWVFQEDWSLFLVTKLRTTNLKMTEFDDAFSEDYKDGTEVLGLFFPHFIYRSTVHKIKNEAICDLLIHFFIKFYFQFHADLYHMSMEITSDAGKERIRSSNYKFIDSVYTILSSIKVLTYS